MNFENPISALRQENEIPFPTAENLKPVVDSFTRDEKDVISGFFSGKAGNLARIFALTTAVAGSAVGCSEENDTAEQRAAAPIEEYQPEISRLSLEKADPNAIVTLGRLGSTEAAYSDFSRKLMQEKMLIPYRNSLVASIESQNPDKNSQWVYAEADKAAFGNLSYAIKFTFDKLGNNNGILDDPDKRTLDTSYAKKVGVRYIVDILKANNELTEYDRESK
ncbi:MAG: hypothetical protein ACI9VM_000574 [Candidatus Azotimanducaceae bacterium]|jgi:hypothetical protein